jgi:hypothetical protein
MAGLTAKRLQRRNSESGVEADVLLTEPNGVEHTVRCLCKLVGTTDIGDPTGGVALRHLTTTYGEQVVWALTRQIALGNL